jgi:hypothetical protein
MEASGLGDLAATYNKLTQASVNVTRETCYQPSNSFELVYHPGEACFVEITELVRDDKLRFEFTSRALRVGKKMCELLLRTTPGPSARLDGMETAARRICPVRPYLSSLGKCSVFL